MEAVSAGILEDASDQRGAGVLVRSRGRRALLQPAERVHRGRKEEGRRRGRQSKIMCMESEDRSMIICVEMEEIVGTVESQEVMGFSEREMSF